MYCVLFTFVLFCSVESDSTIGQYSAMGTAGETVGRRDPNMPIDFVNPEQSDPILGQYSAMGTAGEADGRGDPSNSTNAGSEIAVSLDVPDCGGCQINYECDLATKECVEML